MKIIDTLIRWMLSIMVVATVIIGFYQVFGRYVLKGGISWTEETIRFLYVAIVFLGIWYSSQDREFAKVKILTEFLRNRITISGPILDLMEVIAYFVFYALMIYYGIQLCKQNMNTIAPTTRIPMAIVFATAPIGAVLGFVNNVVRLVHTIRSFGKGGEKV